MKRKSVGELLNTIRNIGQQSINDDSNEEGLHTVSIEPYYYDTSYKSPALREETIVNHKTRLLRTKARSHIGTNEYSLEGIVIAVDVNGKCHLNIEDREKVSLNKWKCDLTCKKFNNHDKQSVIDLKNSFTEDPVEEDRSLLQNLDTECAHGHYILI